MTAAEIFIPVDPRTRLEDYRGRGDNLLVIAPHPDDDVLGAGGTMSRASAQGKAVFSVYMTDGGGSPRKNTDLADTGMAALREKEALAALRAVGARGGFFLRRRSRELEGERGIEAAQELKEILLSLAPLEVLAPAPYERHRTHQLCTRLTLEALRASGLKPSCFGYSLWGCFWGGKKRVVRDITPVIRKKVEAVMAHSSQIAYKNYQQGILGRNNFEAVYWESHEMQKSDFVEVFLDMTELLENPQLTLADFIRRDMEEFLAAFLAT